MNEKFGKSTCAVVILALSGEAGMVGFHFKDNMECRPPVNEAGCLPATFAWLPNPHVENNGNRTVYASGTASMFSSSTAPFGTTTHLVG